MARRSGSVRSSWISNPTFVAPTALPVHESRQLFLAAQSRLATALCASSPET
jgi:hypothetical protein